MAVSAFSNRNACVLPLPCWTCPAQSKAHHHQRPPYSLYAHCKTSGINVSGPQAASATLSPSTWIPGRQRMAGKRMSSHVSAVESSGPSPILQPCRHSPLTLMEALRNDPHATPDMLVLIGAMQTAGKIIASKVARAAIDGMYGMAETTASSGGERDAPKKLDIVANEVMKEVLFGCGAVCVLASEEDDAPIEVTGSSGAAGSTAFQADAGRPPPPPPPPPLPQQQQGGCGLVVVFDPLDGSRNIEVSIPTGTIFGVYATTGEGPLADVLQPGTDLLASGYILYSSATMMVVSLGSGVHGFTLDPGIGEFVLTHPDMKVLERGQIYSLNDARYHDWPNGLKKYIDDIRQGKGQNPKQYSSRYVCSLVADFHRTLIYGGWAANPREHLRLVYEANPLAFLAEQAGGRGSDGQRRILAITPSRLHQRLPLFLGSRMDIEELESYGDVQQLSGKKYDV